MAYCTGCGHKMADDARFCPSCGKPVGAPASGSRYAPSVYAATPAALDYTVQGDNLQVVRIRLKAGQEVYAEAGRMVYKTPSVAWESRMSGQGIGEKLFGAIKRKLMGESLFFTYFRAHADGEVGFAGSYPGRIQVFDLAAGQSVLVQRDSFLAAQAGVNLNIQLVKRVGVGLFGGEGFILEKITGPGTAFIHGGGDLIEFNLRPNEQVQVDTGCIVAFDEPVTYDIQMAGGIKTAIFGGEGLFLATLTGPGRVVLQSMTLEKMRREIIGELPTAGAGTGDQHNVLGNLFGGRE